jgi:putative transposase
VKYEDVYLKGYESMPDLILGLTQYFLFYNEERLHQSLDYTTPDRVYQTATGGGAKIVDKFNKPSEVLATELSNISES